MKKIAGLLLLIFFCAGGVNAQKFVTKTGMIRFYSDAPAEKIEAINRQVNAALDVSTGSLVFNVLMKSFTFEKALMQEHFNEKYVESDKFPTATLVGTVINIKDVNFAKNGSYPVIVEGKLTLHGVTKQITEKGTISVANGTVTAMSVINILLSDYGITIPDMVVSKLSNKIEITVNLVLDKMPG
jgi:polyisoprenoid-binding protein YceI